MSVAAPLHSNGVNSRMEDEIPRSPTKHTERTRETTSGTRVNSNAHSSHRPIKIVVVADVVCMWSYIALREINATVKELAQKWKQGGRPVPQFDVEFRPFFLFAGHLTDDESVDREIFLEKRWGKERVAMNKELVTKRGLELGIHFQFKGKIRQTTRAHRLLYLAYHRGGTRLQQQVLEELYQSYWVRGLDVGSIPFLACVASRLGMMPYNTAVMWLESNAGEAEVKRLAAISNECGIHACPFTVIEGKWAISGGEYRDVLSKTLEKVLNNEMA